MPEFHEVDSELFRALVLGVRDYAIFLLTPTGHIAISVVILLVGATTVFAELQSALDRIWHVPEHEKPKGIWAIVRARLLSFGLILGFSFLLMVSLVVGAATTALGSWIGELMPGSAVLLYLLNLVIALLFTTALFGMIFKLMPTTPVAWKDVWVGSATTAVLFELGKVIIGLYIGRSGMTQSFQAAGSIVVVLAWVYYASQIFLLGAEFTKVYADEHGSLSGSRAMQGTAVVAQTAAPTRAGTGDEQQRPCANAEPRQAHPAPVADLGVRMDTQIPSLAKLLLSFVVLVGLKLISTKLEAKRRSKTSASIHPGSSRLSR